MMLSVVAGKTKATFAIVQYVIVCNSLQDALHQFVQNMVQYVRRMIGNTTVVI